MKLPVLLITIAVTALVALSGGARADTADKPDAHAAARQALTQVERFWEAEFNEVSRRRFTRLEGRLVDGHAGSLCGDTTISRRAIRDNALYCADSDSIIWDAKGLGVDLLRRRGFPAVAAIVAHEFAHAIQERTGSRLNGIQRELQADCYAGAVLHSMFLDVTTNDPVDTALLTLTELGDVPGTNPDAPPAHGTGFDRMHAFLTGIDNGVARCVDLDSQPLPTTAQPFADAVDQQRKGNLSFADITTTTRRDLDDHYTLVAQLLGRSWPPNTPVAFTDLPAGRCDGSSTVSTPVQAATWCQGNVRISTVAAGRYMRAGDGALLSELGRTWAQGAQTRYPDLFSDDSLTTECLTGVWLGTLYPTATQRPSRQMLISPGDLDEAARSLLTSAQPDRIAKARALINGFFDSGLAGCQR